MKVAGELHHQASMRSPDSMHAFARATDECVGVNPKTRNEAVNIFLRNMRQ